MEAPNPREGGVVPAPRKYPAELRERAVRLVSDMVEGPGGPSINRACGWVSSWGSTGTRCGTGGSRPWSMRARSRGRPPRPGPGSPTTVPAEVAARPGDLLDRDFTAAA